MEQTLENKNKAIVLEAFDTLFNRQDYSHRAAMVQFSWISGGACHPNRDDGICANHEPHRHGRSNLNNSGHS
jgi:hypothetical protein